LTDRQTDRIDRNYKPRRFAGGQKKNTTPTIFNKAFTENFIFHHSTHSTEDISHNINIAGIKFNTNTLHCTDDKYICR